MERFRHNFLNALLLIISVVLIVLLVLTIAADDGSETSRPSSVLLDITPEPEPTWPAWLLVTPEVTANTPLGTPTPVETPTPEVSYGWAADSENPQAAWQWVTVEDCLEGEITLT